MANICILANTDAELQQLKTTFENKFKDFNKALGDNCSVFDTVANLLDQAEDQVEQWQKELKDAVGAVVKAAAALWNIIIGELGALLAEGINKLKEMLSGINDAFDTINQAIKDMMTAVKDTIDAIKTSLCDSASDLVKGIDPTLVAAAAVAAVATGSNLGKMINGKKVFGASDLKKMTDSALKESGILDLKKQITNLGKTTVTPAIDLSKYKCVLAV
jgi:phage-related protein